MHKTIVIGKIEIKDRWVIFFSVIFLSYKGIIEATVNKHFAYYNKDSNHTYRPVISWR